MPVITKTGFDLHPDGIFEARLKHVEEAPSLNPDWPAQFKCTFETEAVSEFGQNLTVPYYVSQKLNALSKLGTLVKVLGFDLTEMPNGRDFNTDELLGRSCNLVVEHRDRDDGTKQAKVVAVSPKKNGGFSPPFDNEESF